MCRAESDSASSLESCIASTAAAAAAATAAPAAVGAAASENALSVSPIPLAAHRYPDNLSAVQGAVTALRKAAQTIPAPASASAPASKSDALQSLTWLDYRIPLVDEYATVSGLEDESLYNTCNSEGKYGEEEEEEGEEDLGEVLIDTEASGANHTAATTSSAKTPLQHLQQFDSVACEIYAAAPANSLILIVTQGSLLPVKLLASQKTRLVATRPSVTCVVVNFFLLLLNC
jgi:hypothetical protein